MLSDELFLAIGLATYGETPVNDYGRFSRTLIGAGKIHLDTIKGVVFFRKHGVPIFPLAVHLCGRFGHFLFQRERFKLFFYMNPPLRLLFTAVFSLIRLFWKPAAHSHASLCTGYFAAHDLAEWRPSPLLRASRKQFCYAPFVLLYYFFFLFFALFKFSFTLNRTTFLIISQGIGLSIEKRNVPFPLRYGARSFSNALIPDGLGKNP
jgi:hypothetical protein